MKTDRTSLLNRVDTRLAACAAAAAASLAAIPATSEAAIVYGGMVNINIPSTTAGVYLNVVTGVFGATPASAPGWDVNPFSATGMSFFSPTGAQHGSIDEFPGGNSLTAVDNLAFGTSISAATQLTAWTTNGSMEIAGPTAFNLNSSNNLVGFRFLNETTGIVNFGWMRISLGATSGAQPRAIVEFAYENTGAAIGAGVIPEPSTYALLGLVAAGALGVRAWRGRKTA